MAQGRACAQEKNSFGDCKHLGSARPIIQGIASLIAFFDAELGGISRSFIVDTGNRSWPSSLALVVYRGRPTALRMA